MTQPCLTVHEAAKLDSEDLQAVVVADGYPVWLGGCPLYIVDLSLGCVGQDRVLNGPRHLLDVPDESLVIISCCTDVARGVRCPGNSIYTCSVVV